MTHRGTTIRLSAAALALFSFGGMNFASAAPANAGNQHVRLPGDMQDNAQRLSANRDAVIFTWNKPLGAAAQDDRIIEMVRTSANGTPEAVAGRVVRKIRDRHLKSHEICILIQGFGVGDADPDGRHHHFPALFKHWCDSLPHTTLPGLDDPCGSNTPPSVEMWWESIFMSHGITECSEWMQRFIVDYKRRQAEDPSIPDPARFHFDTEAKIVPWRGGMTACFDAMINDPRAHTEVIPGSGGKTLMEMYEAAGSPTCDPEKSYTSNVNRAWSEWFAETCYAAMDGAMSEAAYQPLHAAWPDVETSNYGTSERYDGLDETRFAKKERSSWLRYRIAGHASMQAPSLYWGDPSQNPTQRGLELATVEKARWKVDGNIASADGDPSRLVPWIEMVGNTRMKRGRVVSVSDRLQTDMLAMLHSRGIREIVLWSDRVGGVVRENWDRFLVTLDEATAYRQISYRVVSGAERGRDGASVFAVDGSMARMTSTSKSGTQTSTMEIRFRPDNGVTAEEDSVAILGRIEAPPGVNVDVIVESAASSVPVTVLTMVADGTVQDVRAEASAADLKLMPQDDVIVRFVMSSPHSFEARVDGTWLSRVSDGGHRAQQQQRRNERSAPRIVRGGGIKNSR